jgi:dolichol-phosphate mannosyltransferase
MERILVFFPTYNESGNVRALIDSIWAHLPGSHILVVDDASPDGTGRLLDSLAEEHPDLDVIHRPRKMGVGSAHKLAMLYAIDKKFDILVTMDADFSHHPRYLPSFIDHLSRADFVTGSRYVEGGSCNYGLYRTFISRTANLVAQRALGFSLKENTTLYRGYVLPLLERLDINQIKSEGYSFAVESMFRISKVVEGLDEFPIHFENRLIGTSKISKVEIYRAVLTIAALLMERIRPDAAPEGKAPLENPTAGVTCCNCKGTYHIEVYPPRTAPGNPGDTSVYSCCSGAARTHGHVLRCLQCGLVFMKQEIEPEQLVHEYEEVEDPVYLKNIRVRERMFQYNLGKVRQYLRPGLRLLDIGSYCGAFLKVARAEGLDVVGLEPSAWAVGVSSKIIDAPVIHGTTADLPGDIGPFDVITLWDVLEHFYDPVAEMKRVYSLLRPEGTFLFSTLMIDNWFARLLGERWPWLMDMHLFYFTDPTLHDMLRQTGFAVMESRNYCHMVNLEYLLSKLGTIGVPGASALSTLSAGRPGGAIVIPFRLGDIKLFVCKKRV